MRESEGGVGSLSSTEMPGVPGRLSSLSHAPLVCPVVYPYHSPPREGWLVCLAGKETGPRVQDCRWDVLSAR